MQVPKHAFREYDIRALADKDLTDELAVAIGTAFGSLLHPSEHTKARVAVARDCRLSSPRLHKAMVQGLQNAGCQVLDVGVGPTPLLYFAVHHFNADGGVMITGSHNPGDENGFKLLRGKAPFFGADLIALRDQLQKPIPKAGYGSIEFINIEDAYVDALTSGIRITNPIRVVLDAGNGAGGPLGVRALRKLGVEVDPLYCDMDGRFPNHHPDPTQPHNLEALIARVRSTGAKLGLAFDGDADRLGAVDANGDIVWGDRLLMLFARSILAEHPGAKILGEVKCSQLVYDDIAQHGGKPILWKTGHSLIKTKMKEEGAVLAGEMSGHLFFADRWFGFDDALYASLRLVEIVCREGKTIGELLADVPRTSITPELRIECPDSIKFQVVSRILNRYRQSHEVIDVDGARILFGEGAWGLVRASNTQPVLVLRFEAKDDARRDALRAEVERAVAEERAKVVSA